MTLAPSSTTGEADLATIIRTYNEVTERLKVSHELLRREVCRLQEQLHEKNRELERRERLAALGEMAAGVAHEIRNPLGGIGLYASLLERDLKDRPQQRDLAKRIGAGVNHLEAIVGGVLAFAGGGEPNRQPMRLAGMLDKASAQAIPRGQELGVRIEVGRSGENVELLCDGGQVQRALLNLLLNAIDAAGRDGRVWVRPGDGVDEDGLFPIAVEDNGPGIAPQFLQRVFNPFFTTKDTGTGLGLAIVHRIAESNGGRVTARNRSGGGASFVLSLPVACKEPGTDQVGGDK